MNDKRYSELITFKTFQERFNYLRLNGIVGINTFGGHRYLNQKFYQSDRWKQVRARVIFRDEGFDLAHSECPIQGDVYIHHLNPITIEDILNQDSKVFDLENLISTSFQTHNAIHYGADSPRLTEIVSRKPFDTCPWR